MKTLFVLLYILSICSVVRTNNKCKSENRRFNPFDAHNFVECLGCFVFFIFTIGFICYLLIAYLP